ncbi:chemotaxis protein CheW [Nocardioides hankookensis]|uniref:Chemotaxis protein CheW n=1 Tax=Nocardioides hankookensis TaxID=443157 RepID=A0ABW1LHJ6_9ACTN
MTVDPVYGLLQLGDLDLALPLSALREVVARPATLAALPAAAPGLVGAMSLRTTVLPVVDLRPLLGRVDDAPADQVVVVVAHEHRVVGLVVDRVCGVTRVAEGDLLPLTTSSGVLLVSHAFQHDAEARPVSVLDAAQLLALPGVPSVAEQLVGETTTTVDSAPGESLTLVRCGPQLLAVEVDAIHTTIPLSEVRVGLLAGGDCRGVTTYAGREVPVVDPLTLVGLPPMGDEDVRAGVVLDLGRGLVVLAVTDLVALRSRESGVLRVPTFANARPELVRGVLELDDGACLVLDGTGLRRDPGLSALATVNVDVAGAATDGAELADVLAGGSTGGPAYVTYTSGATSGSGSGGTLATPLDQVVEILPLPLTVTPSPVDLVDGLVVHRGRAVPVVSLARLLGREPAERRPSSCLLLVEHDDEQLAFAVDGLGGIEALVWIDPDHRERPLDDPARAVHDAPLVRLGDDDRLLPALDLRGLAASLGPTHAPVAAPAAA